MNIHLTLELKVIFFSLGLLEKYFGDLFLLDVVVCVLEVYFCGKMLLCGKRNYLLIWPGFSMLGLGRDSPVCLEIAEDEEALSLDWVSWHYCPYSSMSWVHVLGPWLQAYMSQCRRHCLFLNSLMKGILGKRRKF